MLLKVTCFTQCICYIDHIVSASTTCTLIFPINTLISWVWLISMNEMSLLKNCTVKNVVYYIWVIIWQQVNELRDSATQIEEEIDKTKNSMHQNKVDVARLKGQLERMDTKDPKYVSRRAIYVTGYVTVSSVYSLNIVRNCFIRVTEDV